MPSRRLSRIWQHDPARYAPPRHRRACGYEAFVPAPLSEWTGPLPLDTVAVVAEAERAIRALNDAARAPLHRAALAPFARLLLRTESIASSKVEGLQVGVRALARAEARRAAGMRVGPEAAEVLGNVDAMQQAVGAASARERFTVDALAGIHAQLLRGTPQGARMAGRVRDTQNWIGGNDYTPCGADYVPPPPEEVPPLLEELCAVVADDALPPVMQAALVHAQFETIHPFEDGNGRAGRALVHVVLRRRGVAPHCVPPVSVVLARSRQSYIDGLVRFRDGGDAVAQWVRQFAEWMASAAVLAEGYVRRIEALVGEWQGLLNGSPRAPRAKATAWVLLEQLPAYPVLTAAAAEAATGRARAAVYEAIDQLVAAGVLVPLTTGRRHQAWEPVGIAELLERLEGGEVAG